MSMVPYEDLNLKSKLLIIKLIFINGFVQCT